MKPITDMDDQGYVFGSLFSTANILQAVLDRTLSDYGITARQWYLSAVIMNFFDHPPTLKEVASVMGISHQAVKQIALKLEEKGFLTFNSDEKDGRIIRLHLTDKVRPFWNTLQASRRIFMDSLFKDLSPAELEVFRKTMMIIQYNLDTMKEGNP